MKEGEKVILKKLTAKYESGMRVSELARQVDNI